MLVETPQIDFCNSLCYNGDMSSSGLGKIFDNLEDARMSKLEYGKTYWSIVVKRVKRSFADPREKRLKAIGLEKGYQERLLRYYDRSKNRFATKQEAEQARKELPGGFGSKCTVCEGMDLYI